MFSNISVSGFTSSISNQNFCLDYQNNLSEHSKIYALDLFNNYNFNIVQREFIHQLLQMKEKFSCQSEKLTNRITALIQEVANTFTFKEDSTAELANAFPCAIEFGGKSYQCAGAAFQAQKYTDQPQIMDLFSSCDAQKAVHLTSQTSMTKERKLNWEHLQAFDNQDEVIWQVLKAKFDQNPQLKEKLLETGSLNLVCQGGDPYFHDGFDGSGINILGCILMQLREEYNTAVILNRCGTITNKLSHDIIIKIFYTCLNRGDANSIGSLAVLNKHFNESIPDVSEMEPEDIYKVCPQLKVIDAKLSTELGIENNDVDLSLYPSQILRFYRQMVSHVEGNEDVMLLTLEKGFTPYSAINLFHLNGMRIEDRSNELGNVMYKPLTERIVIMLPLGIFQNSRNKTYREQNEKVLHPLGCERVNLAALTASLYFKYRLSDGKKNLFNDNAFETCVLTSESIGHECPDEDDNLYLGLFNNEPGSLVFHDTCGYENFIDCGAIGMRKLDSYKKITPDNVKGVNYRVSEPVTKLAVQVAVQGNLTEAFSLFDKYDFNQVQRTFIGQILKICQKDPAQGPHLQRVLFSFVKAAVKQISISEDFSFHLANTYPCTIEFNGKIYQCAESAFQAQKYKDQPQIMDLFCGCNGEEAIQLAANTPMTIASLLSFEDPFEADLYRDNVLMQVLRKKFDQHSLLKDILLDTESSNLICQGSDPYFNQNSDGSGLNILGLSLMQLRDEYKES
jgi:predicted NAD-dependent protein-ADP-ribosyltransferase YbiA (DUF1768 family)